VRIDGSNATIITKKPGYFIADRNRIARVWMDHGVWPFFTLELYLHHTGDLDILFEKCTYFKDMHIRRATTIDHHWPEHCKHLLTIRGKPYHGTILEHILIEHLVEFHNVGKHNNIRLEDADWNDGLDMAKHNGESVAFSAFYSRNLSSLAEILEKVLKEKKIKKIKVLKELNILLQKINYADYRQKQKVLLQYLKATEKGVSGKSIYLPLEKFIADLRLKARWMLKHIRKQEWLNYGFFNGYYDDKARRVEGKINQRMRMTLTGQVFPILSGIATEGQIKKILFNVNKFLKDKKLGGFRLNTDFGEVKLDLGRAFGFAYGEKENGAFFSHMNVMFAYALYSRGFAKEGFCVLNSIYQMATRLEKSKIYPGIPEYFNSCGRGMYMYLTGSASWYIFTLLTQAFGLKPKFGDLVIHPKLVAEQFKENKKISVETYFRKKNLYLLYKS